MFTQVRHWLKTMSMVLFFVVSSVAEADLSADEYAVTINLAGKQRMLSQKMAKEALLIGAGVKTNESAAALIKTVALFERTLAGLQRGDPELALVATATLVFSSSFLAWNPCGRGSLQFINRLPSNSLFPMSSCVRWPWVTYRC